MYQKAKKNEGSHTGKWKTHEKCIYIVLQCTTAHVDIGVPIDNWQKGNYHIFCQLIRYNKYVLHTNSTTIVIELCNIQIYTLILQKHTYNFYGYHNKHRVSEFRECSKQHNFHDFFPHYYETLWNKYQDEFLKLKCFC